MYRKEVMKEILLETYSVALPIILTALMGYIVWLLKNQKKDRDANSKGTMLLLKVQLIEYHDRYMTDGDIPSYAYQNFCEMYDAYHDRFVEACQMHCYIEYMADVLTVGDLEERVALVDKLMQDGKIAFLQEYITRKKKEVAHHGEEPENA